MNPETLLERYTEARTKLAAETCKLTQMTRKRDEVRAHVEAAIIRSAGGEKELGGNEKARERNLLIGLYADRDYMGHDDAVQEQEIYVRMAEAELDCIKFEMRLYEANIAAHTAGAQPQMIAQLALEAYGHLKETGQLPQ